MSKRLPTVQDVRGILKGHKIETEADEIERLTARVRELEIEVEAAKRFGGGFYGEKVQEGTREVYRGFARAAITQETGQ